MKKNIFIFSVLVASICGGVFAYFTFDGHLAFLAPKIHSIEIEKKIPDLKFEAIDGKKINLPLAQKTLIVFWAPWCEPCAKETPSLIALTQKKPEWVFVLISIDSTQKEILQFLKIFPGLYQNNIYLVRDSESKYNQIFKTTGVPESFLMSESGILLKRYVGATDWNTIE